MEINRTKRLNNLQFYPQVSEKKQIFLHHTAGTTAQGAIDWWNQTPEAVGTAYVLDRDGTPYEVFDPNCYAYELGVHNDRTIEKTSVGIEIVSAGGIRKDIDGKFYHFPLWPNKAGKHLIAPEDVWEMETEWRGFKYFQKYNAAQLKTLSELIPYLMDKFKIQVQPGFDKFYELNPDVELKHLPGIWSHSTVRSDKSDIIPHPEFLTFLNTLLVPKVATTKKK